MCYFKTMRILQTHRVELYVQLMAFACVFMGVCICLCVCAPMCVGAKDRCQIASSVIFHLIFWDMASHWNWGLSTGLDWLQGSAWLRDLSPPRAKVTGTHHHTCFLCGFWRPEPRSSCLHGRPIISKPLKLIQFIKFSKPFFILMEMPINQARRRNFIINHQSIRQFTKRYTYNFLTWEFLSNWVEIDGTFRVSQKQP